MPLGAEVADGRDALIRVTREQIGKGADFCFGGDVGVYAHGDNVRELELMVETGCRRSTL